MTKHKVWKSSPLRYPAKVQWFMLFLHSRSELFFALPKKLRLMTFKMSFTEKKYVISMLMKVKRCEASWYWMTLWRARVHGKLLSSSEAKRKSGSIGVLTEILSIFSDFFPNTTVNTATRCLIPSLFVFACHIHVLSLPHKMNLFPNKQNVAT